MNERIRELALQAGFETNEAICSFGNYIQDKEYFYADDFIEDELAKFAELLIQQCMACSTWVGKNNTNSVEPVHTAHAINQRIKQQFGVKE